MKGGAELLGVPMPTLYGRYREALREDPTCSKCGYVSSDKSDLARHTYEDHFRKAQKGSSAASDATKNSRVASTSSNVASTSSDYATRNSIKANNNLIVAQESCDVSSASSYPTSGSSDDAPIIVPVVFTAPKSSHDTTTTPKKKDPKEKRFGIRAYTSASPTVVRNAEGLYECEMCPKTFRDNSNFRKHWRRMHNPGEGVGCKAPKDSSTLSGVSMSSDVASTSSTMATTNSNEASSDEENLVVIIDPSLLLD